MLLNQKDHCKDSTSRNLQKSEKLMKSQKWSRKIKNIIHWIDVSLVRIWVRNKHSKKKRIILSRNIGRKTNMPIIEMDKTMILVPGTKIKKDLKSLTILVVKLQLRLIQTKTKS